MQIKFPFDSSKSLIGKASIDIEKPVQEVFHYVGERFFDNYPKWAVEVVDFEPLDGKEVFIGAKAKQIRDDNGVKIESIFQITHFEPTSDLTFEGVSAPYRHTYLFENQQQLTRLTFSFELLELEVFMRPFEKLIRCAIEDGAESTVENIKNLVTAQSTG